MSIVTKKGDSGLTDFPDTAGKGYRQIKKDHPYIECIGTIDELDAFLALCGIALKSGGSKQSADIIEKIRKELLETVMPLTIKSIVSDKEAAEIYLNTEWIENQIKELEKENTARDFYRSWTNSAAAAINTARTVCRRCERRIISAIADDKPEKRVLSWFNRVSDLLFLIALKEEQPLR